MERLLEPLQYAFFIRALIMGALVGAACGLIGVFVTVRRMSYVGHGLAHAAFGGAVLAYVSHGNFYLGAGAWVFGAMLLVVFMMRQRRIPADAAVGLVTTASFALGVVLLGRLERVTRNLESALFGCLLGVTDQDVQVAAVVVLILLGLVVFNYKGLLATAFDPDAARVVGVPVGKMDLLYAAMLAAVMVLGMRVLGATLLAAAVVVPAMTARMLTDRFRTLIFLAPLFGAVFSIGGLYVSFFLNVAAGAAIVLTGIFGFLIAACCSAWRVGKREKIFGRALKSGV